MGAHQTHKLAVCNGNGNVQNKLHTLNPFISLKPKYLHNETAAGATVSTKDEWCQIALTNSGSNCQQNMKH